MYFQYAKLRMLEFYHDFLMKYFSRRDFALIQCDTDSIYMALSTNTLDEAVTPDLKAEYEKIKFDWLVDPGDIRTKRTPGLFKTVSTLNNLCV